MHRYIAATILFSLSFYSYSQTKQDTIRLKLSEALREGHENVVNYWYARLAYDFSVYQEYDSALKYYGKIVGSSQVEDLTRAESHNAMGVIFSIRDYFDSSVYHYNQAKDLYQKAGDLQAYAHVTANLAILLKDQSRFQDALDVAFETLKVLGTDSLSRELASCYNTIATVYKKMEEYDQALEFQKKALSVRHGLGLTRGMAQSYNNIGETFIRLRLYDSALVNLRKSLDLKRALDDQKGLPATLNNLALALIQLKRYSEAEKFLVEAIALNETREDRLGFVQSLSYLVRVYVDQGQFNKTFPYIIQAEQLARQIGALDPLAELLQMKIVVLREKRDYASALKHAEELQLIRDSLFNIEKVDAMFSIQARYEADQKEQEIQLLNEKDRAAQLNLEAQRRWIITLVIGVSLLTAIVILVFLLFRATRKGKDRAELLLQEMHHRMKNNLQILSGVLSLQSQELKDEKALEAVKESESRVHAMALIHKKLYNTKEHRTIQMHEYINELVNYLRYSFGFGGMHLDLKLDLEPLDIDVDKAIPLGLILNELILNAFKHAFIDHPNPMLCITMVTQKANQLVIRIEDNGIGQITSHQSEQSNSFGIKMVNLLIRDLSGSLATQNSNGITTQLTIPL
jgi:two-component system, sensor histidine kinase PdtaS